MTISTNSSDMKLRLSARNAAFIKDRATPPKDGLSRSQIMEIIFDSVADGLMVFDKNKTVVMANETAARLAHWQLNDVTRDELRKNYQMFHDDGKTPVQIAEEPLEVAMAEKRSCEREGYITSEHLPNKGGWVRSHAAPLFDDHGDVVGGVTVFHDISVRKRLEHQRDCLVTLIAHDIKNHLAAESTFLMMLSEMIPDSISDLRAFVDDLKHGNERFLSMTDSLMELSRANFFASADHGISIPLSEVLKDAVESNKLIAKERSVEVILEGCAGALVWGLPDVVWQVFHNIILNAIEVSEPGASVSVQLSKTADEDWQVRVTDTGKGMTPDEVAVLFDPHRVAGHVRMTSHSTGFGLYLSAMLIQSQGGSISCESKKGQGTTIVVELPRSAAGSIAF